LSGSKTVLGFFQSQNNENALNGATHSIKRVIERASAIWSKPGFFESITLGRFVLDGAAILASVTYLQTLFPSARILYLGAFSMTISFVVSHWMIPMFAQAFSPSLGGTAIQLYRIYSTFFMG